MKANKKLAVVALGCVASLAFGGAVLNMTTASAESVNADKFEMEYGVQLALRKDAMRWIVSMGQNVYDEVVTNDADNNVTLSFVVSSKTQFEKISNGEYVNIPDANKTVIEIPDDKIYKSGDYYYANAALTNIFSTTQSEIEIVAVGVITTANGGSYTYEYANFNDGDMKNNVRVQYDVLQQVALDTREEAKEWAAVILGADSPYKAWFGTEEFPIVVDTEDKYNSLVTQINNGVEINMNVELYTKNITADSVQLAEGKQLPASITKYHTVNFYNGEELLDTVTIKDGEDAVYGGKELKSTITDISYGGGCINGERFSKWVTENNGNVEADLMDVNSSMNVYVRTAHEDITKDLLNYAKAEEPKTVLYFDREVGFTQIANRGGNNANALKGENRSYSTDKKLAAETGSLKISYADVAYDTCYVNLEPAAVAYSEDDYVSFSVYAEAPSNITAVWIRLASTPGVQAKANTWTLVTFKAKDFYSVKYLMLNFRGFAVNDDVNLYFSKATIVPSSQVKNMTTVSATETWQLGDTTLVGTVKKSNWSSDYRTDIFKQDTELNPTLINGQLMYYGWGDGAFGNRQIGLEFATPLTGKVYITARGLSTIIADGKTPYLNLYTSRSVADANVNNRIKWVGTSIVKTLDDGYSVYEFDFGTTPVGYILLFSRTEIAGQQILIKNISTTY